MQALFEYMLNKHGVTLLSSDMDEIEDIVSKRQGTYEILKELERAETIHPFYPIDPFKQLAIMQEEAGEVTKAVLDWQDGKDTVKHVREELIQTAAMCMRMLKNLDGFPADDTGVQKSQVNVGDEIEYSFSKNGNRYIGIVYFNGRVLCILFGGNCHLIKDLVDIKILNSNNDYVEVKSILRNPNEYKEWTKVSRFLASGLFGVEIREINNEKLLMTSNVSKEKCPKCGAIEIDAMTPRTVYECGSSDYDQRPNTFIQSEGCKQKCSH